MVVAKPNFKQMAEDLESLLAASPPPRPAPVIDESYLIAAETQAAPETPPDNSHLIPHLVRSVVEYTLSRTPESTVPTHIGGAITAGLNEAIKHLGLDRAKVAEAADAFMAELAESVQNSLVE
jgi:hypothetical protein